MKKLIPMMFLMLLAPLAARAEGPRFSWGLEWGYTGTFLRSSQHNFICEEGYRIIDNPQTWWYFSNGTVTANAGVDLTRNIGVSAYSGLRGVYSKRWVVPAGLKIRWSPVGLDSDGLLVFAGGGAVFPTAPLRETGLEANAGAGYRIALRRGLSVDFLVSWNFTLDHENIADPDTRKLVPRTMISSNTCEYQGINFSVALNF